MIPSSAKHTFFPAVTEGLSSLTSPASIRGGAKGVSDLLAMALSLAHSEASPQHEHARNLDTIEATLQAIAAASSNPEAHLGELSKMVPLLNRGFEFHESFEGVQRGLRAFLASQGSWGAVQMHLNEIEQYRSNVERTLLSISERGENAYVYQIFQQLGVELEGIKEFVTPSHQQVGLRKAFCSLFRADAGGAGLSGMQGVSARATLAKREGWYNEFNALLRGVIARSQEEANAMPLLSLKDALRWGALCARIGNSSMDAPAAGFNQSHWSSVWAQFRRASGPLFAILPSQLKPSGAVDVVAPSVASVVCTTQSHDSTPDTLEVTGAVSLVSRCDDMLRRSLSSGAAKEIAYAFQKSFLWGRTSPDEKVALVEQVVSWHRHNLDAYGVADLDAPSTKELRSLAERMLCEDVSSYASPKEVGLIRCALEAPVLTFQKRQNLIHTLTTVYSRSILRTTVASLTERFLARGVREPVYSEVVAHNLPAINERLGSLAESYAHVYPGILLSARWGRDGDVVISVSQGEESERFEANDLRANPVFFGVGDGAQDGVLNRAIQAVLMGRTVFPTEQPPISIRFEFADARLEASSHRITPSGELSPEELTLIDWIFASGRGQVVENSGELVGAGAHYCSGNKSVISTPCVRADGVSLYRREDGSLVVNFGKERWAIEGATPENVSFDSVAPGTLLASTQEWAAVELAFSRFFARQESMDGSYGSQRGGIVALHLDGLIGSDELSQGRIQRMACAAAHLDFATVVVVLGSSIVTERFAEEFERIERSDGAKPLLCGSSDNLVWAGGSARVVNVLARSELTLQDAQNFASGLVLEDPIVGEESSAAIYTPWLFHAQQQARR